MNMIVNEDVLAGRWKQVRGRVKQWWGKLTGSNPERISGRKDVLIGIIQERYGYTRKHAHAEIARWVERSKR